MRQYNKQDVMISEELYWQLRPWIKHPNLGLFTEYDGTMCPACECTELKPNGFYNTAVARYQSLRCMQCGSLSRERVNVLSKKKRKNQIISL